MIRKYWWNLAPSGLIELVTLVKFNEFNLVTSVTDNSSAIKLINEDLQLNFDRNSLQLLTCQFTNLIIYRIIRGVHNLLAI